MFSLALKLIHIVARFLFPSVCVGCGEVGTLLCATCTQILEPAEPLEDGTLAALSYHDPRVRQLIWHLKYRGSPEAATLLAPYLHQTILAEISRGPAAATLKPIILIPVPMTRQHLKQRGWNQAIMLAEALVALDPNRFEVATNILIKIKNTPTQVCIKTKAKRLKNLTGAFALTKQTPLLKGRVVCLLDDVTTTGATLREARQTLQRAKPRHLLATAAAHG
ncbi:MAG: hypothetical protein A2589_03155 [Candidatus Vogelbacteria bacterium RIFOXYD1_FULL_46_19]|uniref:Phosphoribosyltransferase domain-containing protein n=1 Tax=Candidatus Vogelbacteria bacterium RIFOXYD1_FULL_46_19 TaxID=1802439 RepID=A0A1G2QIM6_9BACT|nr:MAG: hypothetical protein A2589_03155 [Candidatus Vogelbacteria bacterium RIFOXYD1_FULL_46_19]